MRDLPRRTAPPEGLVEQLTDAISLRDRCPGALQAPTAQGLCRVCDVPMVLRLNQALALHDVALHGGPFVPLGVGQGKTLVTLVAPWVIDAQRPLLLLPANLIEKTKRERVRYSRHWPVLPSLRIMSYEMLAIKNHVDDLDNYAPDLIMCDEAHYLKNRRASRTRRVARYMHAHPETRFLPLSGTMMGKAVTDFGHLLLWSLKDGAPIPKQWHEVEEWSAALGEDSDTRPEPGALFSFCTPDDGDDAVTAARRGFRRRLVETPGVVAHAEEERVNCSIHVRAIKYDLPRALDPLFAKVRAYIAPADDFELMSGAEVWFHAKALALGLSYVWDPRPPPEWREPRRQWGSFVRETISRSRTWDSEAHVAEAIDQGMIDDGGVLASWRTARPTFEPNSVPVWHDDTALRLCAEWGKQPGIIWTDHAFFAERLADLTGLPYYAGQGLTADGRFIEDADPTRAAIVSTDANREGKNLQGIWSRNLITCPWESATVWEQAIGRTHRPGQRADEVTIDVLLGCAEHASAWEKANARARAVRDTTGAEQKILLADVEWPSLEEIATYRGSQWSK